MTLEEMKNCGKEVMTPTEVSGVLRIHPSRLIEYGRRKELPFPVGWKGNRKRNTLLRAPDGKCPAHISVDGNLFI